MVPLGVLWHFLGSYAYKYMKIARRGQVDSCKRSTINQMAAGLRLPGTIMEFFFFLSSTLQAYFVKYI